MKILISLLFIFIFFSFGCISENHKTINEKNISITTNVSIEKDNYSNNTQLTGKKFTNYTNTSPIQINYDELRKKIIPETGIALNVTWGSFAPILVEEGVLDVSKLNLALKRSGYQLTKEQEDILKYGSNKTIHVSQKNSLFITNLFWALGLSNNITILKKGRISAEPSMVSKYASTGGWTLGNESGQVYLSSLKLINLSDKQTMLVWNITSNTYRPCCNNPASFPDCNHGMAALGLTELMISQNLTNEEINKVLLIVNSYWFPQDYLELAAFFKLRGKEWEDIDPKILLSKNYSSSYGSDQTRKQLQVLPDSYILGSSCGV